MDIDELMTIVTKALAEVGVPYMVTGSMATIFYGEPRFTTDIDILVDLKPSQVRPLREQFAESDYYLSEEAALLAIRHGQLFNIIHPASGLKVDLIVAGSNPVNLARLRRARETMISPDTPVRFAAPEDVILAKLQSYRQGGSDKHLRDIGGVVISRREELDLDYIARQAEQLGVADVWRRLLEAT